MTLKELRTSRGLTQVELADALGVSDSAITMWETGDRVPKWETIRRIAEFFDTSIDNLEFGHKTTAD